MEEFTNVKRDMNGGGSYQSVSHTFSNGITVVNTTPHNINFQSPEGDVVTIPTSVKPGEKTGFAVVNASPIEKEIAPHVVDTDFTGNEQGQKIIDDIKNEFKEQDEAGNLMIVGSMIAANAYPDVKGMCPAPGFERVPPDQKRMSCEKFTQGDAKATPLENLSLDNTVTKQEIDDLADRIFEDFDRAVVAVMSEIPATIPFTNTHGQARGIG